MKYTVLVNENSHYQDEEERYTLGEFEDCQSAIAACKQLVDEFLEQSYQPGITADELYTQYTTFGEDPFVSSADAACFFSAWDYAKTRCAEITSMPRPSAP